MTPEERLFQSETSDLPFRLVSVVIPVLDAADTLPLQLEALTAQTYRGAWEVVIADNGSTDGSGQIALSFADRLPGLRVVDAGDRRGCSHARNVGARAAAGDFLAVCDADDEVAPGWIEGLVEAGRRCDIVGGRLDQDSLNAPITRSWRPLLPTDRLPVALDFLPYAVGANCGLRTEVFRALGGWREDLAVCGDDVEFSWRAQLASYRICFAPEAVVRYRFREEPRATARQFLNYGRVEPRLYRDYRTHGMPRSDLVKAVREWLWLILRVDELVRGSPQRKTNWMRKAAYRWGRLRGSIAERVLYP